MRGWAATNLRRNLIIPGKWKLNPGRRSRRSRRRRSWRDSAAIIEPVWRVWKPCIQKLTVHIVTCSSAFFPSPTSSVINRLFLRFCQSSGSLPVFILEFSRRHLPSSTHANGPWSDWSSSRVATAVSCDFCRTTELEIILLLWKLSVRRRLK